ncbi:MAG TPA: 5'-methylthioadenosine/S-adenosylhomocysteine nucleosidase [Clostridiales bacterium]|nr:5'-methylthioadenosine/S-adenosylhomocysteine nucleosidase [Clostridiales bacterium]
MKPLLKVGIICPCKIEYDKCKSILNLSNETNLNGRTVSSKKYKSCEVIAVFAGPGKIQCASATQLVIDKFNVDMIIDVGGVGSLVDELVYNDIIVAKEVYEYDVCEIEDYLKFKDELTSRTILSNISNEKNEHFEKVLIDKLSAIDVNIKFGNIASGEKTVKDKMTRDKLHSLLNAHACDWETSSVIKTANLNDIKALSIRVITDNADEKMEKDFYENWGNALEKLYTVLNKMFEESLLNDLVD